MLEMYNSCYIFATFIGATRSGMEKKGGVAARLDHDATPPLYESHLFSGGIS